MPDSSNKGGRKPRVTDEDLLDVFRATSDPVLSTAEVAEQVPIKRRGVLRRLRNLEEDDQLESKQIGGRNTVWWLPNVGATQTPTMDEGLPATDDDVTRRTEESTDTPAPRDGTEVREDPVEELDLPGSGEKLERRREAVRACYEYVQEQGKAKPADFREDVYPDHPAMYTEGEDPAYSWWTNCMYKGMKQLAETDDRLKVPDTTGEWRYE